MNKQRFIAVASVALAFAAIGQAEARDQIHIVGSSTVYPFSSYVGEELGATTNHKTPVIESTGSGGGMKLFCAGDGMDTPDITNASRRMKAKEFDLCAKNGVNGITEVVVGYDGIALAQSKNAAPMDLTKKEILLAVAAEVPNKDGDDLIANPYHYWDQINSKLPHRKIIVFGPPTSSGTRDAFEDMGMKHPSKKINAYQLKYKATGDKGYHKYHKIRQDGVYVPSGENDNLIIQKLVKDADAVGIFGYSYLEENSDRLSAVTFGGVAPAPKTVQDGSYPFARSLYFYIKKSHEKNGSSELKSAISDYVKLFTSKQMVGEGGACTEIGLIALPEALRAGYEKHAAERVELTKDLLVNKQPSVK